MLARSSQIELSSDDALKSDLNALKEHFVKLGYFRTSSLRNALFISGLFSAFIFAICMVSHSAWTAYSCMTAMLITAVWWIHDAGHDAFFSSRPSGFIAIEFLGIVLLGMLQNGYHHYVHRRHHGFTNIVGMDPALQTAPILWDESQAKSRGSTSRERSRPFQPWAWLLLIVPLTYPIISFSTIRYSYRKKQWLILALLALRWGSVLFFFKNHLLLFVLPHLIAGSVLGLMASLNHFHMPMRYKPASSPIASVFLSTQNLRMKNRFWTWISGGLNFHIEHHLFPKMPHRNYAKIAPHIRSFAKRHQLPYQEAGLFECIRLLFLKLLQPGLAG